MNWFMKIFGREDKQLQVGSRVRVHGQKGTVTSGSLNIKFDKQPRWLGGLHPNHKTSTFNINSTNLEIL